MRRKSCMDGLRIRLDKVSSKQGSFSRPMSITVFARKKPVEIFGLLYDLFLNDFLTEFLY
jgi:hypothetical protein